MKKVISETRGNKDEVNMVCGLSWEGVKAKRLTNPAAAAEDEACTEPTAVEVTTGACTVATLVVDIRLFGAWSPGITGETQNAEPLLDGTARKPDKEGALSLATRQPSSYRLSSTFPPQGLGSAYAHCDTADKLQRRLAHLGLKHSSHSVLYIWAHDPYDLMVGGEFNVVISDPTGQKSVAKSGASLHVRPHKALLWVGHASKYWHMASRIRATRNATASEPDVVDVLQPGVRTRSESDDAASKVVGIRGTVVFQTSEVPVASAHLARQR